MFSQWFDLFSRQSFEILILLQVAAGKALHEQLLHPSLAGVVARAAAKNKAGSA